MPATCTYDPRHESEVVALWTQVFGYAEPRNDPRFALQLKHAHGDGLMQLARDDAGALLATGMAGYDGHRGWLYGIAVAPQLRRHGHGRAMVAHLETLLAARGAPKINLQIRAGNEAVCAFYEALGYRIEARQSMGRVLHAIPEPTPPDADAIRIEPYRPRHEADVSALWQAVFGYPEPRNQPRRVLADKHTHGDDLLLLALDGPRVLATAMAGYDGHRGWLYRVAVAPPRRRSGIARRLVREAERRVRELGAPKMNLQVLANNRPVIAFWQALGYTAEPHTSMGKVL